MLLYAKIVASYDEAYRLLQADEVAAVFGVAPSFNWYLSQVRKLPSRLTSHDLALDS